MNIRQSYSGFATTMASRSQVSAQDLDVSRIAQVLWSGRRLICAVAATCALLAGIYGVFIASPIYRATAVLVLQHPDDPLDEQASGRGGGAIDLPAMKTEVEIIQSHGIIYQLVNDLDLMQDAEFNPALSDRGVLNMLRSPDVGEPQNTDAREAVIRNVQSAISAQVRRNTYLFEISAVSRSGDKAALIANQLAEIYLDAQLNTKISGVQAAIEGFSERVSATQRDLLAREDAVASQRALMALTSPEELRVANGQLADVRARLRETRTRAAGARGDAHLRLQAQVEALEGSVQELTANLAAKGQELNRLQQLEREADAARVLYETLLSRLKTSSVLLGLQQSDARLLTPAVTGVYQSPRRALLVVLSCLFGAILAGGYVVVTQLFRAGFRTVEDLENATHRAVLGKIPMLPDTERSRLAAYLTDSPDAPAIEAVRDLRTSLLMSRIDEPPRVILVASALSGEGKTTQAVALAQSFVGLGKRVLLIEGDLRRRTLGQYLTGQPSKGGVVSVLMDQVSLPDAVLPVAPLGVDILPGEVSQTSAADIFASRRFEAMIDEARALYDVIVIDSPPVLLVPDAKILARHADATLFIVAWDKTARRQVMDGLRQFDMVNCPVSGLVLTQIHPEKQVQYGYGYLTEPQ